MMLRPWRLAPLILLTLGCCGAADARDDRPNVVLLMLDQWRHDWTPQTLPALRMPTWDQLVRKGTRFTRATSPAPLCNPARASLATGLSYLKAGILSSNKQDELPMDKITIYQLLRKGGVHTATVGKDDLTLLGKLGGEPCAADALPKCGNRRSQQLGFQSFARCYGKEFANFVHSPVDPYMNATKSYGDDHFKAYLQDKLACNNNASGAISYQGYDCPRLSKVQQDHYIDDWIAKQAMDFITDAPTDKPFFLQVNYAGPHPPFIATKEMKELEGDPPRTWPSAHNSTGLEPKVQQSIRQNYALLMENIDSLNQDVLNAIAARGDSNRTVVCIFSDHGEMLGDFWDRSKVFEPFQKSSPWQASIAVPLVCAGPGVQAGRVIVDPTTTLDLSSTILDLQGVKVPEELDSKSLKDVLSGAAHPGHPAVSTMNYGMHRFSTAQKRFADGHSWKLTCCRGLCPYGLDLRPGAELPSENGWERMLFDLDADPLEERNLYDSRPDIAAALRPVLEGDYAGCGEDNGAGDGSPGAFLGASPERFLAPRSAEYEDSAFLQERYSLTSAAPTCPATHDGIPCEA